MTDLSELLKPGEHKVYRSPCVEGCNIGTWIGFKHVTYLFQQAILDWLKSRGLSMGDVFTNYGLATEMVSCQLRFVEALRVDDVPGIFVDTVTKSGDPTTTFKVRMCGDAEGAVGDTAREKSFASGKMQLSWSPVGRDLKPAVLPCPKHLEPFVVSRPEFEPAAPTEAVRSEFCTRLAPVNKPSVVRCFRISYPMCCYTDRIQFSAYVDFVEGMVDEFLADRGVSIATLLRQRNWIPVVTRFKMNILSTALMEDWLFCVFQIEDVMKDMIFSAKLDCYVIRNGEPVKTMTCEIDHAYLHFDTRSVEARVVPLDEVVLKALRSN